MPALTGSLPFTNTIGMADVAALAASAALADPQAKIAATSRRTRSAANGAS
jgi:hypothetical protein